MPNLRTSIKDLRQSKRKTFNNNRTRRRLKVAVKTYSTAVANKDVKTAERSLPVVQKMLDKAAKRGIIKKGTASRRKSRLNKKLNTLSAPNVETSKKSN